jgi:hypothetical protein
MIRSIRVPSLLAGFAMCVLHPPSLAASMTANRREGPVCRGNAFALRDFERYSVANGDGRDRRQAFRSPESPNTI